MISNEQRLEEGQHDHEEDLRFEYETAGETYYNGILMPDNERVAWNELAEEERAEYCSSAFRKRKDREKRDAQLKSKEVKVMDRQLVGEVGMTKQEQGISYNREQIDLIKNMFAKGASDNELQLLLYQSQRTGLDILSRQIYLVKRKQKQTDGSFKEVATIQTGIDGYRAIASKKDLYAGNDDYKFNEGISEYECIKQGIKTPTTATATVYKMVQGQRCPFSATARWEEYYPGDKQGFMWNKMPFFMIGKCAEALAHRKAFPADLSGIYIQEEMQQIGDNITNGHHEEPAPTRSKPATNKTETLDTRLISEPQNKRLRAIASNNSWSDEEIRQVMISRYKIEHSKELQRHQYQEACDIFEKTEPAVYFEQ